ncbi:MAG: type II toxin-antitoxin system VapC family toxin [Chloroflexota bacterium]
MGSQSSYRLPYLDSSFFIAWIKGEVTESGINRAKIAEHILWRAEQGDYHVVTCAATLAEVHKPRGGLVLPGDLGERILSYFEHDFVQLVDVNRAVGEHAHRLAREFNLNPFDAIHLASALRAGCDVLLAWDDRLIGRVNHPAISVEEPRMVGQSRLPGLEDDRSQ